MSYYDLVQQMMTVLKEDGWDAAINYINKYINENPNNFEAYLARSELYSEMNDFEKAFDDSTKAIMINPEDAYAYNNRGLIYCKSGNDMNKALNDFTRAIELNPNYCSAYSNRANIYSDMKEYQKAISDYTKAIESSPDKNVDPFYNRELTYMSRANTYSEMGEDQKAISDCTQAIEISPNKTMPYHMRGYEYMRIGETEKALNDYNKVIDLESENAQAYYSRGDINSRLGKIQDAMNDYEIFLQLDPNNEKTKEVRNKLELLKSGKNPSHAENYDVLTEKKEKKILLILSGIGFILGAIIGASSGITESISMTLGGMLLGMWFGIGIGGALTVFTEIYDMFMWKFRTEDFTTAIKTIGDSALYYVIMIVVFAIAGPIGFLVRFFNIGQRIKKFIHGLINR